jgi:hypothetical protein
MARRLFLVLLAPALSACYTVASLETAVPAGSEVFEPRLVGTWELREDTSSGGRLVITREGDAQYLVRDYGGDGSSTVLAGRLGPLGAHRWLFELSPVGDTTKYTHSLGSKDSTRLGPPEDMLLLPIRLPLVIERPDSGLVFAILKGDSLLKALQSGAVRTPFTLVARGDIATTVLLTEQDAEALNRALQAFVDRPGVLMPLPRVGRRITVPSLH